MSEAMNKVAPILSVTNLKVRVDGKEILRDVSLSLKRGEVLVLFGPNGVGKSTLLKAIMGVGPYKISGAITFKGEDIIALSPEERAKRGLALAFQGLPKMKGLRLRTVAEEIARRFGTPVDEVESLAQKLGIHELLDREVGRGFSGGQAKRAELLLTLLQGAELVMIDEPDSGVDLDGIKVIGEVLREYFQRQQPIRKRSRSGIVITHSGAILNYLTADTGMVIINGVSLCFQNPNTILQIINEKGYDSCLRCLESGDYLPVDEDISVREKLEVRVR